MQGKGLITVVKTPGERIRKLRDHRGLTQKALAKKAGVSQGTIGNLEAGIRKNPRALLAIAEALRTTPQWLESGKGSSPLVDATAARAPIADTNVTIGTQSAPTGDVPMTAEFNPINVSNTIHLLGKFLGMYDENSKTAIAGWMQTLVNKPNQAPDIARKMALLAAEGQEEISKDPMIEAAMKRGRRRPVDTTHGALE